MVVQSGNRPPRNPYAQLDQTAIERAAEQLRQERETFEQHRVHEARWFALRLIAGYVSVLLLLPGIAIFCAYLIVSSSSTQVVKRAETALFVDILAIAAMTWKVLYLPTKLAPLTQTNIRASRRSTKGGSQP